MLRFINYSIVFQEIPEEITLAINISGCTNKCKGCHSTYLWENIGDILDECALRALIETYKNAITCVCFMGGDNAPEEIEQLAKFVRNFKLKIAWYSGKDTFPESCSLKNFDFIKLGKYIEALGGLQSHTTNQKFYKIFDNEMIDATYMFL